MHRNRVCALTCAILMLAILLPATCAWAGTALAGKKIGLSPGHGREWNGTGWVWARPQTCAPLTQEDLHNVDLAIFLNAYLAQDGADVKAYRCLDKSYGTCPLTGLPWWQMSSGYWLQHIGYPESVYASNWSADPVHDTVLGSGAGSEYWDNVDARPLAANYDATDIIVGLHTNAFDGTINGTEIFYEGNDPLHQPWWTTSRDLATFIENQVIGSIRTKYGDAAWTDRGVKEGSFHEPLIANMPAAMLELAFHDTCSRDAAYLNDPFFQSTTMWSVYRGVCEFLGVTPTYDYYSCELVSSDIPATMIAGQTSTVHLTFKNHGVLWMDSKGFRLEGLVTPDPFTPSTYQPLPGDIGPNESVTFAFDLTAPTVLGPYQTGWMMNRQGVGTFGPVVQQLIQVVDATDDTEAPSVPTGVSATPVSFNRINLSWTPSTDNFSVAGYKIYRNGAFVGSSPTATYSDAGLLASTTYSYEVSAYDASGNESAKSAPPALATTFDDGTPPAAPGSVTAVGATTSRIDISWTASWDNTSVASYKIFRNGTQVGTSTGLTYADNGLAGGTAYTYRVSAVDPAGNQSSLSAPAVGRTLAFGDQVLWSSDFESYTDQASFLVDWPGAGTTTPLNWSSVQSSSPTHSAQDDNLAKASAHAFPANISQISVGSFYEFRFYDPAAATSVRHFATIRSYTGGGYNNGSLSELLTIGCNTGQGCTGTKYNGRSTTGVGGTNSGWFDLTSTRSAGWHTMRIDVIADTTNPTYPGKGIAAYSVDGVVGAEKPIAWKTFTCCTVGSANTSTNTGNYYYDDVKYGIQGGVQRLSGPSVVESALGTVTVTWNTDVNSSSVVDYGLTASYGSTASDATQTKTHSVTITGLAPATPYHLRATSQAAGKTDSVSEDVTFTTAAASLSQLKGLADGTTAGARALVVSAVLPNGFYVQDTDRVCGIKVLGTQAAVVGGLVDVTGELATDNGERVLNNAIVTPAGTGTEPKPLGLSNRGVGGPATGAANTCLLVTAWGRVTEIGAGVFWIDDGSGIPAADGKIGIKVCADGLTMPALNAVVAVTGISGAESVAGGVYPVLRPRTSADVIQFSL